MAKLNINDLLTPQNKQHHSKLVAAAESIAKITENTASDNDSANGKKDIEMVINAAYYNSIADAVGYQSRSYTFNRDKESCTTLNHYCNTTIHKGIINETAATMTEVDNVIKQSIDAYVKNLYDTSATVTFCNLNENNILNFADKNVDSVVIEVNINGQIEPARTFKLADISTVDDKSYNTSNLNEYVKTHAKNLSNLHETAVKNASTTRKMLANNDLTKSLTLNGKSIDKLDSAELEQLASDIKSNGFTNKVLKTRNIPDKSILDGKQEHIGDLLLESSNIIKEFEVSSLSSHVYNMKDIANKRIISAATSSLKEDDATKTALEAYSTYTSVIHARNSFWNYSMSYHNLAANKADRKANKIQRRIDKVQKKNPNANVSRLQKKHDKMRGKANRHSDSANSYRNNLNNTRAARKYRKKEERKTRKHYKHNTSAKSNGAKKALKKAGGKIAESIASFFSIVGKVKFWATVIIAGIIALPYLFIFIFNMMSPIAYQLSSFSCFMSGLKGDTSSWGEEAIYKIQDLVVEQRDDAIDDTKDELKGTKILFCNEKGRKVKIGKEGVDAIPLYYDVNGNQITEAAYYMTRDILTVIQQARGDKIGLSKTKYLNTVKDIYEHTHHHGKDDYEVVEVDTKDGSTASITYCDWDDEDAMDNCGNVADILYHDDATVRATADEYPKDTAAEINSKYENGTFEKKCSNLIHAHGNGVRIITDWSDGGKDTNQNTIPDCNNLREVNSYGTSKTVYYNSVELGEDGLPHMVEHSKEVSGTVHVYICNDFKCGGHEHVCKGHITAHALMNADTVLYDADGKLDTSNVTFFEEAYNTIHPLHYFLKKNNIDMSKKKNVKRWNQYSLVDWETFFGISFYDKSTGVPGFGESIPLTEEELAQVNSQTDNPIAYAEVEWANTQIGMAYVWGSSHGNVIDKVTKSVINHAQQVGANYDHDELAKLNGFAKQGNINCYDCSGFVYWVQKSAGINANCVSTSGMRSYYGKAAKRLKATSALKPGYILFYNDGSHGHTIVYAGQVNGQYCFIEAKGINYGVVATRTSDLSYYIGKNYYYVCPY